MSSPSQQNTKAAHERHRENDPQSAQYHGDNIQDPETVDNSRRPPHRREASVNGSSATRNIAFDPIPDIEPDQHRARDRQGFSSHPQNTAIDTSTTPLRPASENGRESPSLMGSQPQIPPGPSPRQNAYVSVSPHPSFSLGYDSLRDAHNQPYACHSAPHRHEITTRYGSGSGFQHAQEGYAPAQSQPHAVVDFSPRIGRTAHSSPGVYRYHRDSSESQWSNPSSPARPQINPVSSPPPDVGMARRQTPRSHPQSAETTPLTNRGTRRSETPEAHPSPPPPRPRSRRSRSRSPIREPAREVRQRTEEENDEWFRGFQRRIEEGHRPELGKRYGPKFKSCKRCERFHMKCVKAKGQEKCDECFRHNVNCVPKEEGKAGKKPNVKSRRPRPEDGPIQRRMTRTTTITAVDLIAISTSMEGAVEGQL